MSERPLCVAPAQGRKVVTARANGQSQANGQHTLSSEFAGEIRVPPGASQPLALDERKIIARRAALALPANAVVNLGVGMPAGIELVAEEEGIDSLLTLRAEPGVICGAMRY